jgi:integrase/recombinase XerD
MNTTTPVISPLRQRMLEDMRMRKLAPKTQIGYIRAVRHFAGYLGRSPDQASAEDLRRYQLHCVDRGISPITLGPQTPWMRPSIPDSARWASNGSSTPVR